MEKRVHLFITGDVIGVGFRAWTVRQAQKLNLTGWARNASFETVEVVAEGEQKNLDELIKLCHKGPEVAWVEKVDVQFGEATGEFEEFEVR